LDITPELWIYPWVHFRKKSAKDHDVYIPSHVEVHVNRLGIPGLVEGIIRK